MVANCLPDSERVSANEGNIEDSADMECSEVEPVERGNPPSHRDINPATSHRHRLVQVDPTVRYE